MAMHADEGAAVITFAVVASVLKICLLIGVGVRLELNGFLDDKKRKCLSGLAMDVCLPCLMFASVLPEANITLLYSGWELLLVPVIYVSVGSVLGVICCLAVGTPMRHLGVAAACAAFPNVNGFPVSIVTALGTAIPRGPNGFSALVYLSLIQITDGLLKYTIGPAILKRDKQAMMKHKRKHTDTHGCASAGLEGLPLGASMRSIHETRAGHDSQTPSISLSLNAGGTMKAVDTMPDFGVTLEQIRSVEPDWSRHESYAMVGQLAPHFTSTTTGDLQVQQCQQPLLTTEPSELKVPRRSCGEMLAAAGTFFKNVCPPQVLAVVGALAIGVGPPGLKALFLGVESDMPPLGFVYGTASQLGDGFVPLQMISLGGRLVGIASSKGPLASKGAAGPGGRSKLLKISFAVAFARMVASPVVLYYICTALDAAVLEGGRPLAWWAPCLIVAACPTANNMSTMADMVGAGRSISAASTALQLLLSPLILTVTLSVLITGVQDDLASDFRH